MCHPVEFYTTDKRGVPKVRRTRGHTVVSHGLKHSLYLKLFLSLQALNKAYLLYRTCSGWGIWSMTLSFVGENVSPSCCGISVKFPIIIGILRKGRIIVNTT